MTSSRLAGTKRDGVRVQDVCNQGLGQQCTARCCEQGRPCPALLRSVLCLCWHLQSVAFTERGWLCHAQSCQAVMRECSRACADQAGHSSSRLRCHVRFCRHCVPVPGCDARACVACLRRDMLYAGAPPDAPAPTSADKHDLRGPTSEQPGTGTTSEAACSQDIFTRFRLGVLRLQQPLPHIFKQ